MALTTMKVLKPEAGVSKTERSSSRSRRPGVSKTERSSSRSRMPGASKTERSSSRSRMPGASTKAERFAKLERNSSMKVVKREGVTKQRMKLVKPLLRKGSGVDLKICKRKGQPSKIAKGRLRHFLVYTGRREKTSGGLKKDDIGRNKRGRYVSLKQHALGVRCYHKTIKGWNEAFTGARSQLKCFGFVAINGRTLMGQALYCRMKKLNLKHREERGEAQKKEELPCSIQSRTKQESKEDHEKEGGEPVTKQELNCAVKRENLKSEATTDASSAAQIPQTAGVSAAAPATSSAAQIAAPMNVPGAMAQRAAAALASQRAANAARAHNM